MKSLKLWFLVVGLAAVNLTGCSRVSTKAVNAGGTIVGREVAESRLEVSSGTDQNKPSPCIKRENGSERLSKRARRAKGAKLIGSVDEIILVNPTPNPAGQFLARSVLLNPKGKKSVARR
jgi:hypothetical protein